MRMSDMNLPEGNSYICPECGGSCTVWGSEKVGYIIDEKGNYVDFRDYDGPFEPNNVRCSKCGEDTWERPSPKFYVFAAARGPAAEVSFIQAFSSRPAAEKAKDEFIERYGLDFNDDGWCAGIYALELGGNPDGELTKGG